MASTNTIPTSSVIVGQLGGGLGDASQRTTTPSPGSLERPGDELADHQLSDAERRGTATGPGTARAVVLDGGGGGNDHFADLE